MLENCQPDSEKGIAYTAISKWPKLVEVVTYLSYQSKALLRFCIMISIKINANFSVASKKPHPVTLSKAEIYSVYFTPFKPSHLQAELRAEPSGNLPLKEEVSSKSEQTGSERMTWWCPQVVSLPWWLLQTGNLLKGMIISFPALWSKDSLLVFTRYWDPVRQTLLATSRGSKLPCVQDLVVVRWVHDFLQEKKPQRKIWN